MTQTFNDFGLFGSSQDDTHDKQHQHKHDATKKFHEEIHNTNGAKNDNYDCYGTVYKFHVKEDFKESVKENVRETAKEAKRSEISQKHLSKKELPNGEIGKDGSIHFAGILGAAATEIAGKHSGIIRDSEHRVKEIDYPNGQSRKFAYDKNGSLKEFTDVDGISRTLDTKSGKWVLPNGTDSGISQMTLAPNGTLSVTNTEGLTTSHDPDRSITVEKPNHTFLKEDVNGNLVEIFYNDQKSSSTKFEYFESGEQRGDLKQIVGPDGQYMQRGSDGRWLDRNGADTGAHDLHLDTTDGSYQYLDAGNHIVTCGTDGQRTTTSATLDQIDKAAQEINEEENHTAFGQPFANGDRVNEIIQNLNSTDIVALQRRYENIYGKKLTADVTSHLNTDDSTRANENLYLSNLENDAAKFIPNSKNDNQREQFIENMNTFLVRAHQQGMTADEIARTFASTQRILEATDGKVSAQVRERLAQQIMAQAAHPERIAQGNNNTCNVTDIEIRTWATHPAVMANMVADVALDGSYTARDGKVIVIPPTNLVPEPESIGNLPIDGQRSFASQLIQAALINDVVQRESSPVYFSYVPPSNNQPEDSYWTDANGKPLRGDEGKLRHFAGISFQDIGKEAERITGVQQTTFVHRDVASGDGLVTFGSEEELRDELERANREGRFPIIIGVSAGDKMFGGKYPMGDTSVDKDGKLNRNKGGHVVCIDSYDPNTGLVQLDNSWRLHYDKVISVHELYQVTD